MYWFAGTDTAQQMSTANLQALSKSLTRSMVTKALALILSHNIKQFMAYLGINLCMFKIGRSEAC